MPKCVSTVALASVLSLAGGAPLLRRGLQLGSDAAADSLTVTPFSYPYPVDGNTMGLQCNTQTSEADHANTIDDFQTGGSSFTGCLYETIIERENIPEAMCACMGVTTSVYDICPDLRSAMSSFLCSQDVPFCERTKNDVAKEPQEIPFGTDEAQLELPFESPELPLPGEIKNFVSESETSTASLLWMANTRNYQLAQNFKCANGREKSYTDREVLPGWKTERLFTPEYKGAPDSEEGLPWVSVSSRGKSLLIVVRGTQTFAEWVSDMDLEQVPSPLGMPGKLARGFSTVAGNVLEELQKMITRDTERVIVTGHSLGGFAGTVVASGLQRHIESAGLSAKLFGVLFASGRVGDAEWQEAMNSKTNVRFVSFQVDPVPFLVCQDTPNCGLPGSFDFSQMITDGATPHSSSSPSSTSEMDNTKKKNEERKQTVEALSSSNDSTELMRFADRTGVMTFSDYWLGSWGLVWGLGVEKDARYLGAAHSCSYQCHAASSQPGGGANAASLCSKETCFGDHGEKDSAEGAQSSFFSESFVGPLVAEAMKKGK
uniref:Fungal lipase-type domain-containing protein n=1 Tax=Chromera velia CCMP2878 TaxID=1169474 RepID=A0A0G4I082_9ALVE|eukprot:Cvel_9852.t1-p1 / transcript=Cvel_9852.t1 / gene=Cvel_9852 / organism=Chromera_velia_CCMP2878 / gene_product=hypothetical protein / transcript_product=hypothetical protein / location=Cvel_scaffold580:21368-23115(+) / protein_length=544 / sequence_SO=supercontig / SO=protein_coding / is_pseudo=false